MDSSPSCDLWRSELNASVASDVCLVEDSRPVLTAAVQPTSRRAIRVCFVSHGSGRGGAEEVLLETAECLKENGFDCLVLMPGDVGLGIDLRKLDIPFWKVPYWPWMGNSWPWRRVASAARNLFLSAPMAFRLSKWNPDIIYSNTMTVCFGALLAKLLRRPHVWHLHELGLEDHGLTFDFGPRLSYRVLNSASAYIAVSQVTAKKFAEHVDVDPESITVILQSLHRSSCQQAALSSGRDEILVPERRHALRCVIVGRVSEGKRQEDAVRAIAELKQVGIDAELLVVGSSNPGCSERLQSIIDESQVQSQVFMTGWQPIPQRFIQSSDVVLMCSRFEAFGRVTVEGMLAGKPVVAANTGANPELIKDGITGLLYRAGDPCDLAAKIRSLHENPELATRIGQNARAWAEQVFNKDRFSNDIVPFLRTVADTSCKPIRESLPH